ncbi:MAG: hypothetical protein QCH99_08540 [Candidatus Bathyarchaeota archaeon]|nr:hypothetical protein [Candidatus Bathyarchaeum tardum]WGM89921.1 MAG: hypothetical protein NUK63_02030 [Candidatus Bathyarchaeum tardum]
MNEKSNVKFDDRLGLPLDFVCKIMDVTREDFTSLALSNLLDEELDWIDNNDFDADNKELKTHKITVNEVKFEANSWVINKK